MCIFEVCISSVIQRNADLLIKKLDWDVNDEADLISALLGAPLTLGAWGKLPLLPPPPPPPSAALSETKYSHREVK